MWPRGSGGRVGAGSILPSASRTSALNRACNLTPFTTSRMGFIALLPRREPGRLHHGVSLADAAVGAFAGEAARAGFLAGDFLGAGAFVFGSESSRNALIFNRNLAVHLSSFPRP